jgi:hypothetical protein
MEREFSSNSADASERDSVVDPEEEGFIDGQPPKHKSRKVKTGLVQ